MNRTTGEPAPAGLSVMVHAMDKNGNSRGMVHGESSAQGRFELEGVPAGEGFSYAVMTTYENGTYFSEPKEADGSGEVPFIEVSIYESTADPRSVRINIYRVFISYQQGGLSVAEAYSLSNAGDRTVAGVHTLEDGSEATLEFTLPEGAANVTFPSASADRFQILPGGFVDRSPLVPGEETAQVIVMYVLPYEQALSIERYLPFAADEVIVYLLLGTGLQVEVPGSEFLEVNTLGAGKGEYEVYHGGSLANGQPLQVRVSGSPQIGNVPEVTSSSEPELANMGLIGMGALGIMLIASGAWLRRRVNQAESSEEEELWEDQPDNN